MLTTTPFLDAPKERAQEPAPPPRSEEERRAWYQEALDSLEHYERTGLHITLEELEEWVERLETDPHAPMPECHT